MDIESLGEMPSIKNIIRLKKKYDAPTADELPDSYKTNSEKERLYLWAVKNFKKQVSHMFPNLKPLCLTARNECGVEKLIMTFVKPTVLPYSHLFDIDECAHFVSDYLAYQSREFKDVVWSPTYVLATQLGNSLEMSLILCSFLSGYGYKAFVVSGWVTRETAKMDRSKEVYKMSKIQEDSDDKDSSYQGTKYTPKNPPELKSKYLDFLENLKKDKESTHVSSFDLKVEAQQKSGSVLSGHSGMGGQDHHFHAWVYVSLKKEESELGFFIETTSGERKRLDDSNYLSINSVWNNDNYWLAKNDDWRSNNSLDLANKENWIKFVCDLDKQPDSSPKRLLSNLHQWLGPLVVPADCFELLYRLGLKTVHYKHVRVEYFAPYLLKEGIVQKVTTFSDPPEEQTIHILEKYRHRVDKLIIRETFPANDKVIEKFGTGRKNKLKEHEFYKFGTNHPAENITKYYASSRLDGLSKRISRDMELTEEYEGREDGLIHMSVNFGNVEKKFGPADQTKGSREVTKITQRFELKVKNEDEDDDALFSENFNPGRSLDSSRVMERTFDLYNERILLKFHRENGQIFCKTVEFFEPRTPAMIAENKEPELAESDVKVYLVDPRENPPCLKELNDVYKEHIVLQLAALKQVASIEKEMHQLTEDRMKELSANDLDVWVYDTKRNSSVQRGRQEQELASRRKEESIVDLEMDFIAPYLQKYPDINSLTKAQAMEVRDDCLSNIMKNLQDKEADLTRQINEIQDDVEKNKAKYSAEDLKSKGFLINVLSQRLKRQKIEGHKYFLEAEKKVKNDQRILKFLS